MSVKVKPAPRRAAVPAYAKINLYLDVLGCRTDGFHELLTVMHTLSLHDDVQVSYTPAVTRRISLRVSGADLPTDRSNLVFRAAEAFLDRTGINGYFRIFVKKRIPISAGLAGGSADAAATLRALNLVTDGPLDSAALLDIAATLGSDVPFCLVGGTQICRGRGEKMEPLSCCRRLYAVVVKGEESVSTPHAFAMMDGHYSRFDGSVPHGGDFPALLSAVSGAYLADAPHTLYNAFEPVTLPTCPAAATLRTRLLELGAYAAHMSGSGPSVFGLFRTLREARAAAAALGAGAYVATSATPRPL